MPTPRAWRLDHYAPTTPPALAWPAWLAFAALVMAVGLVQLVARSLRSLWRWVRIRVGVALIDLGARIMPETGP